jgi:hypothetical protein
VPRITDFCSCIQDVHELRSLFRESVPYVKINRYNPKHLYPKLNGYGDNGNVYVLGCRLSLVRFCDSGFGITPVDDITIGITYYYYYYYYYAVVFCSSLRWRKIVSSGVKTWQNMHKKMWSLYAIRNRGLKGIHCLKSLKYVRVLIKTCNTAVSTKV